MKKNAKAKKSNDTRKATQSKAKKKKEKKRLNNAKMKIKHIY